MLLLPTKWSKPRSMFSTMPSFYPNGPSLPPLLCGSNCSLLITLASSYIKLLAATFYPSRCVPPLTSRFCAHSYGSQPFFVGIESRQLDTSPTPPLSHFQTTCSLVPQTKHVYVFVLVPSVPTLSTCYTHPSSQTPSTRSPVSQPQLTTVSPRLYPAPLFNSFDPMDHSLCVETRSYNVFCCPYPNTCCSPLNYEIL